jgi:hypothetical protein
MKNGTKFLINSMKAFSATSVFLFASLAFAEKPKDIDSNFKLPQGIDKNSFIDSRKNESQSLLGAGSWYDAGNGPGTLTSQGEFYFSDVLDSNYSSGFMTGFDYSWSGSFNGWSNVDVYACIINTSGSIVGCADVTTSKSGNLSMPANTFPTYYDIAFAYIVDRPLVVNIYKGPNFGIVTTRVQYQY